MKYTLYETEEKALALFLKRRECRRIMKNGGVLAVLFSAASGVGTVVTVKIRDKDGNEAHADITDYSRW